MELEQTLVVQAPPDAVWAFLTDPHRVAACLPGAAITGQLDERTWAGTITVKVGPVSTSYRGKLTFERLDPAARTAEIQASGQDVRGKGGADMRMTSRLVEHDGGATEVTVRSQVSVTGILAQLGRGMIQDVSDQMFQRFAAAMRAQLEAAPAAPAAPGAQGALADAVAPSGAPTEAEPIEAVSFGARLIGRALGRAARRPAVWLAVVALAVLILWFWLP
jgi:carbon monoxide dehydrogenase subunit G